MIPPTIEAYLRERYPRYEHHTHATAETARQLAAAEHVAREQVAKPVVLKLGDKLVIAVVAATDRVNFAALEESAGARPQLVAEAEFSERFRPCDPGAEPPLSMFGAPIFVDDKLVREKTIVMPAGTHEDAVVLETAEWLRHEGVRTIANLGQRVATASRRGEASRPVMFVRDAMTKDIWTCQADETLAVAARIMWDHDVGAVPVVVARKLVGIVTDRDICMAAYFTGKPLEVERVGLHMSTQLYTAAPADPVEVAEQLMRSKQVHRLPVVEADGSVVGMVSLNDLARVAAERGRSAVDSSEIVATLAAIARPRARLVGAA